MNFIKRHKNALIVILICLVLIGLAALAIYRMFYPSGDKSIHGDRLQDAPVIEESLILDIKTEMMDSDLVNEFSYNLNVRIMKFFIDVKSDAKIAKAQSLSKIILDKLPKKITTYYDIEIYLTQETGDDINYPAIGYRSKESSFFSWTINKEGVNNEE